MNVTRTIKIALVSPGDVEERWAFHEVVEKLRLILPGLTFTLLRWEDAPPGLTDGGPQGRIEDYLRIQECDVLVGMFFKRFGEVDSSGESRTQREILCGLKQREARETTPEVMVYFCVRPYTPSSPEEAEEQARVLRFKRELQNKALTANYTAAEDFKLNLLVDLFQVCVRLTADERPPYSISVTSETALSRSEGQAERVRDILVEIVSFATEPIELRIALLANTNITNRLDDEGVTDIILINRTCREKAHRGTLIAKNAIQFPSFVLAPGTLEAFTISGTRINAALLSLGGGAAATMHVAVSKNGEKGGIFEQELSVARLEPGLVMFYGPEATQTMDDARIAMITAREGFAGAFKTRGEEYGDFGTILALQIQKMPDGIEVFVTARDIPASPTGKSIDLVARAAAIILGPNLLPQGWASVAASPV